MNEKLLNDIPKQFLKNHKLYINKDIQVTSMNYKKQKEQNFVSCDGILIFLILMIIFDFI